MTILAWVIIGLSFSFGVIPGLFDTPYNTYKESWILGHTVVAVIILMGSLGAAIMWAGFHLLQVYVA